MKQILKKGKAKGTVLFSVVTVMMIMVLFLMSTLIFTTSANRRAYYTYFETQAQFAAQAALDAITSEAYGEENFYTYISNGGTDVSVDFSDTNIPVESVVCRVEPVANNVIWDSRNGRLAEQPAWKITATAVVGTGRNRAEYTVSNYIYEAIRDTTALASSPTNNMRMEVSAGLSTRTETTVTPGTPVAMTGTEQGYKVLDSSVGGDNGTSFGSTVVGGDEFPWGRTKIYNISVINRNPQSNNDLQTWNFDKNKYGPLFSTANENIAVGNALYMGSESMAVSGDYQMENGQGVAIFGDLYAQNSINFRSLNKLSEATSYQNLPYVYVDNYVVVNNDLNIGLNSNSQLVQIDGANPSPVNLYAGAVHTNNDKFAAYGDVYLWDPHLDSWLNPKGSDTFLYEFINNNVTKSNGTTGEIGGNLVCNNAAMYFQNRNGTAAISGDFVMTNRGGTLFYETDRVLTVKGVFCSVGDVYVGGNKRTIEAKGGIYIAGSVFSDQPNREIYFSNGTTTLSAKCTEAFTKYGVNYYKIPTATLNETLAEVCEGCSVKKADGSVESNWEKHAYIGAVDVNVNGETYADTLNNIVNARPAYPAAAGGTYYQFAVTDNHWDYDFGLYPFSARPDEIQRQYVRWDLRGADGKNGYATKEECQNYIDGGTDWLMNESIAAGHTYVPVKKTSTSLGERYFPACTPVNSSNAFIGEVTITNSNAERENALDSYAKLTTHFTNLVSAEDAVMTGQTVDVYSHTPEGTVSDHDTLSNVAVVTKNCMLNIEDYGTIFIDPTREGHNPDNPLVVAIYNEGGDGELDGENPKIIINNTAQYPNGYSGNVVKPYCNPETIDGVPYYSHATRKDVIIYFMGPDDPKHFSAGKFVMIPSGFYKQWTSAGKKIDFVENVYYPGDAAWDTAAADQKYKFEMIPNNLVYGGAGTIRFSNGACITGAIIAPNTSFDIAATTDAVNPGYITYRLSYDSNKREEFRYISCIGSVYANQFTLENLAMVVYAGPVSDTADTGSTTDVNSWTSAQTNASNASGKNGNGEGNYFDNLFMGN